MRGEEVKMQRATEGEACLDAGQSAVPASRCPQTACFDRLFTPARHDLPLPNAVQRRDPALETAGNLANVG